MDGGDPNEYFIIPRRDIKCSWRATEEQASIKNCIGTARTLPFWVETNKTPPSFAKSGYARNIGVTYVYRYTRLHSLAGCI